MSQAERQNSLLNDYIRTLERENDSKTNQIRTLTLQNDQLIQECEMLRQKSRQTLTTSSASTSQVSSLQSTIQKLESELKQSKSAYSLLLQQTQQGGQVQKLREDFRRVSEQKLILQQYKQKLERDLKSMGFSTLQSYSGKIKQIEYQLQSQTKKSKSYETRIVEYERKLTLLTNEVTIKNSQIERLSDKVKLVTETKSSMNTSQQQQYEQRIDQYETKITQLTNQLTMTRSQVERLKQKQSQLVIVMRDSENYKRQIQALNSKITSLSTSSVQINTYQTTINSLRDQKKQWQRQRQQLRIKLSDLQTQVVQKSNTIGQLMLRQQYLKTKQTSQSDKNKQIDRLNSVIRTLRVEIQDHKRTISARQSTIKNLQSRLSSTQYSKSTQISSIQRIVQQKNLQINRIIESHNQKVSQLSLQIERYKSMSIANAQFNTQINSLRQENNFLKRQTQNSQSIIQQLQREKQMLKLRIRQIQDQLTKSRINQSQVKTFITKNQSTESQLTKIVRQLRGQLQEVKKSNAVIHQENHKMHQLLTDMSQSQMQIPYFGNDSSIVRYHSPQNISSFQQQFIPTTSELRYVENQSMLRKSKHYHQQPYFKSQMNLQKKRQQRNDRSAMSPVRDVKLGPNMSNKQKWESLQRKISALRVQNDQLKRTLLFE